MYFKRLKAREGVRQEQSVQDKCRKVLQKDLDWVHKTKPLESF